MIDLNLMETAVEHLEKLIDLDARLASVSANEETQKAIKRAYGIHARIMNGLLDDLEKELSAWEKKRAEIDGND